MRVIAPFDSAQGAMTLIALATAIYTIAATSPTSLRSRGCGYSVFSLKKLSSICAQTKKTRPSLAGVENYQGASTNICKYSTTLWGVTPHG
jgi:hypothetical protein